MLARELMLYSCLSPWAGGGYSIADFAMEGGVLVHRTAVEYSCCRLDYFT